MGTNQTITPSKSEKSSSIIQEQPSVHPFPDWASMQAYYGPGVPIQAPYFSAAVPPCHTPHPYMWSPQPMLTPFGGPYTAIYPHGVYPHTPASHIASPMNPELPAITSTSKERGFEKKIKGLDKLATSIADCNVKGAACKENRSSESGDNEAEGSNYGSDVNNESGVMLFTEARGNRIDPLKLYQMQDERELKQEKRKQSNRESARRSRLRKQAETEELAIKVGTMTAENTTLRAEITRLTESSDKLRLENSALMEKLRMVEQTQEEDMISDRIDDEEAPSIAIKNLLSSIDNSSPVCDTNQMEDESFENSSGKLHQLLDPNPKSDSLTAS